MSRPKFLILKTYANGHVLARFSLNSSEQFSVTVTNRSNGSSIFAMAFESSGHKSS